MLTPKSSIDTHIGGHRCRRTGVSIFILHFQLDYLGPRDMLSEQIALLYLKRVSRLCLCLEGVLLTKAIRSIDIPVLSNVINYDFPAQPKIFVHRVGRTARAGLKGSNYNLVSASDVPYLLDLQLFLDRPLIMGRDKKNGIDYTKDVVLGSLLRDRLETHSGMVSKLLEEDIDLLGMRNVAIKGDKQYLRYVFFAFAFLGLSPKYVPGGDTPFGLKYVPETWLQEERQQI